MIANITQGASVGPLVQYHEDKIKEGTATVFKVANVLNGDYPTGKNVISEYASLSDRKDKIFHVSINFPEEDYNKIGSKDINDILDRYMVGFNFPKDHPYIAYLHRDTKNPHLHIVTTSVDEHGKHINQNHNYRAGQRISRSVEKAYDLKKIPSEKNYKAIDVDNDIKPEKPSDDGSHVARFNTVLYNLLYVQRIYSEKQLAKELEKQGIIMMRVEKTNTQNKALSGIVFFPKGKDFKRGNKAIKSSDIKVFPSNDKEREKLFSTNRKIRTSTRSSIKSKIDNLLSQYQIVNPQDLAKELKELGVDSNLRFNEGRLIGVSFTDIKSGMYFTGEQIGKEYTSKSLSSKVKREQSIYTSIGLIAQDFNKVRSVLESVPTSQKLMMLAAMGYDVNLFGSHLRIKNQFEITKDYLTTSIPLDGLEYSDFSKFRKEYKLFTENDSIKGVYEKNRDLAANFSLNDADSKDLLNHMISNLKGQSITVNQSPQQDNGFGFSEFVEQVGVRSSSNPTDDSVDGPEDSIGKRKRKKRKRGRSR